MSYRVVLLGLLLVAVACSSRSQIASPPEHIKIIVDAARFRGANDSTVSFEIYYAIPRVGLTNKVDSSGFSAGAVVTAIIYKGDSVVFADRWIVSSTVTDTSASSKLMNLVGMTPLLFPRGDYRLVLKANDRNALGRMDSTHLVFKLRPVASNKALLSDIEFSASIAGSSEHTMFYKNTYEVIPNVGGLYSSDKMCYYYLEAYNLTPGGERRDYIVRTTVCDAVGRELSVRNRTKKKPGESMVIVDQMALDSLRSGTYTMIVALLDSAKNTLSSVSRKFFVFNAVSGTDSSLTTLGAGAPLAILKNMDETDLDEEFREVRYITGDAERKQFAQLKGAEPKRSFLSAFWRGRPTGYRDEYLARVVSTNSRFSVMGKKGYRTDRGRVYIVYGAPDDVERHPNESESRSYEIWTYNNVQGGVIFVFLQRDVSGDYELVHSTHRSELHDENWQRLLTIQ
jgi:GWxTD domain-containing protein